VFVNKTGTPELLIDVRKFKIDWEAEAEELLNKLFMGRVVLKILVVVKLLAPFIYFVGVIIYFGFICGSVATACSFIKFIYFAFIWGSVATACNFIKLNSDSGFAI
jgi:hypothetical protein